MREATGLSMNEIGRRTGISSGRLSIIERGVTPTPTEHRALLSVLVALISEGEEQDVSGGA